jgi:purine-nucleoside phosphorylase
VKAIRKKADLKPKIGVILGSGLGGLAREVENPVTVKYADLPHFPKPTVEFHAGQLVAGVLGGKTVVTMEGRFHYYEGYSMQEITFPVRVLKALGVETLVVSNASGGMNPQHSPGDLVIMTDHINLMGDNPLIGYNDDKLGPRFPDMSEPYSRRLIELAEKVALEKGYKTHRGVYVAVTGPNLETAAEYRFLRGIGADNVGMSTVPEVLVAIHGGMEVLGLSIITDACLPDALKPSNIDEIIRVANEAEPKMTEIVIEVISRI